MMIRKLALTTIFAFSAIGQVAVADPRIVEEEVTLRISKDATAEQVYVLLWTRANDVCESRAVYPHKNLSGEAQCRQQFVQDAVSAINRPALTALHRERIGSEEIMLAAGDP